MKRTFKYRIYPTKAQALIFDRWIKICRELYNAAIEERREAWKQKVSISFKIQSAELPEIKKLRPDVETLNAQVLQNVLHRVDLAYQAFFRRIKNHETPGYPRFKGHDRYNSFTFPQSQSNAFSVTGKRLHLSKIGDIKIKTHRPAEGVPKTCTIKREANQWYAFFSCDGVSARVYPPAEPEVGIDVGLVTFATLSTGEKIDNPRWYRKTEEQLKAAQRALSRKKRGSNRRTKAKLVIAKLSAKTKNQRQDFHHKLAHRIVSENALIAVEDLDVKEMIETPLKGLPKSISDAGWSTFLSILGAKAEEAGRRFAKVPASETSSTCSQCLSVKPDLKLGERIFHCDICGLVLDRDINASYNILRLGRSLQGSVS